MTITVEAVRLRINAVTAASPAERRARLVELMTAGVEMTELVARYQGWLEKECAWLDDDGNRDDPEFAQREERYLKRISVYQESHDVLGEVLVMVKEGEAS